MTQNFTFRQEVITKYDEELYLQIMDLFDCMPIAALVANKYLAMHGGISPNLNKLADIDSLSRF